MSRRKLAVLLGAAAVLALSGCGSKEESAAEPSTAAPASEADVQEETEPSLDPITPSDYLVSDSSKYITLGDLSGLTATQTVYEITDEMVQQRIDDELYMYSEESEIEEAQEGSIVYVDISSMIQGDEASKSEESTYFTIGDADYGEEFDEKLIGAKKGDKLSFSISYDEESWFEEWVGQTVDFELSVTGVYELITPELDEDFVSSNTEYGSVDEYTAAIRESIEDEYTDEGYNEAVTALFQAAMDRCTFNGYPEDLYAACEQEILSYYGQFIGEDDKATILDTFGISEDDFNTEVLNTVNTRLLISAVCQDQGIEVTEDEYVSEVNDSSVTYGYASAEEYEDLNTRDSIVWALYENKVAEYLYDSAEISTVEGTAEEFDDDALEIEMDDMEFESEEDDLFVDESESEAESEA